MGDPIGESWCAKGVKAVSVVAARRALDREPPAQRAHRERDVEVGKEGAAAGVVDKIAAAVGEVVEDGRELMNLKPR